MLHKAIGMRYIRRWSALAWLAWAVHVPAFAVQFEMLPSEVAVQSMVDSQTCATCVLATASVERTVDRDDNPTALRSSWVAQLHQPTDINEATIDTAVRLSLALRVLYCRWLN